MARYLLVVIGVLWAIPQDVQAQTVQISGTVGGSKLVVSAANAGGGFSGGGKLTAPNGQFYYVKVQSGAIIQGRYVSLQGVILAPSGAPFTSFVINADQTSGGILFMYTGASGTLVKQFTTGTVVIQ